MPLAEAAPKGACIVFGSLAAAGIRKEGRGRGGGVSAIWGGLNSAGRGQHLYTRGIKESNIAPAACQGELIPFN